MAQPRQRWDVRTSMLLVLCAVSAVAAKANGNVYIEDTDRFPGWKGELPRQAEDNTIGYGEGGVEEWRGVVEQISWSPRAFLFKKFLSDAECDHLINNAKKRMVHSKVVDSKTGKGTDSKGRTSTGTFYERGKDEIISAIERRISHISFLPVENGEGIQILHYVDGEKYDPHHDFFHDNINTRPEDGGQRIATVLMYLTTPEEGGETVFPMAETKSTGPQWSDCARKGLAVKATRGTALLFYSLLPNGETDPHSLHGSCPTTKGDKYSATKWIHVSERGGPVPVTALGGCVDMEKRCSMWAAAGECKKTPKYMLTNCRKSCKTCGGDTS